MGPCANDKLYRRRGVLLFDARGVRCFYGLFAFNIGACLLLFSAGFLYVHLELMMRRMYSN